MVEEFIGCRSVEAVDYDGKGNNLYNMWLTDTPVIRCRDCKHLSDDTNPLICVCKKFNITMCILDGFCAWAERK